ncbi:MAG: amidohydrolase [Actinomycetia bacterium]|nr:amidohydrolase [Actinomycetes bacterium]
MKIDAFCHIMPRPYYDRFFRLDPTEHSANLRKRVSSIPCLVDMDVRFAQMDEFGDYRQIINIAAPPVEDLGSPRISKEEMGALGAQIYTHVHGRPMDDASFDPFYATAARIGSVIQVHPCRSSAWADYPAEERSRYEIWWTFGWEYDLSAFMARIVFSGVLERYPELKLLIHHGGSIVPHFAGRVGPGYIRATIKNLEEIGLWGEEQEAIFSGNIIRLTGLAVKGC